MGSLTIHLFFDTILTIIPKFLKGLNILIRHHRLFWTHFILSLGLCVVSFKVEAQSARKKTPTAQNAKSLKDQSGQMITRVTVRGQKRLEVDAVLSRVTAKENEALNPDVIRGDILALFESGFFESVEATFNQGVLTYL
ncbi:MAG: POTRA domain-containing protein, partial [Bdellovibrionales bacterium]